MEGSRWTFITQQEHPVLRRPWYAPHPCETAALMRLLLTSADADVTSGTAYISGHGAAPRQMGSLSGGSRRPSAAEVTLHKPVTESFTSSRAPACVAGADVGVEGVAQGSLGKAFLDSPCQPESGQVTSDGTSGPDERGLRYLGAWLSLVAPAVGLPVPVNFWQQGGNDQTH